MGGKALSQPSVRVDPFEYGAIWRERVAPAFAAAKKECSTIKAQSDHSDDAQPVYSLVESLRDKESYGDMDIVLSFYNFYDAPEDEFNAHREKFINSFLKHVGATEHTRNGNVLSCGILIPEGLFQIDLIVVESSAYNFARFYFAYNDCGNLLGRIAHFLGFKLGWNGLKYVYRDSNNEHVHAELTVTLNWQEAMHFLGFRRFPNDGFPTREAMFEYVWDNPHAHAGIFLLENRNHIARTRDSKRPNYTAFLQWIQDEEGDRFDARNEVLKDDPAYRRVLKAHYLSAARRMFPTFDGDMEKAFHTIILVNRRKQILNFDKMCEWEPGLKAYLIHKFNPDLQGLKVRLWTMYRDFLLAIPEAKNVSWVLNQGEEGLRRKFRDFLNEEIGRKDPALWALYF